MNLQAAILAGGLGKRFRPYTDIIPKPMVPLGESEKPLLEYIITWLARGGIRNIVLLVGYRWKYIYNYFGDGTRFGVKIAYSLDDERYRDTGGALLKAVKKGAITSENVLVWYGDIVARVDVGGVYEVHKAAGSHATLVVAGKYQVPVGIVYEEGGRVLKVEEKPWLPLKAFIGIAVIKKEAILEAYNDLGTSFDIMSDLIPYMIRKGYRITAYTYDGPWFDVGSLERYEKLDKDYIAELEEELGFKGTEEAVK